MEEELFGKCPFATAQRLIQGKWAILILHHLSQGPVRFNELRRRMPKMTHATLSTQLKQLEKEKLIRRAGDPQIPPKVEYSLTEMGGKVPAGAGQHPGVGAGIHGISAKIPVVSLIGKRLPNSAGAFLHSFPGNDVKLLDLSG